GRILHERGSFLLFSGVFCFATQLYHLLLGFVSLFCVLIPSSYGNSSTGELTIVNFDIKIEEGKYLKGRK
ncbi:MAG: hypothetical protein IKG01_03265, partial [Lachnospiraceae bacterium]|nr:hypothetical protein [Lachnospiraceae bacterium]